MQVSQTDAAAGENERNENVAVAPVDLNILKDLLVRIGTTATIIPQFLPDLDYFGSEYGVAPSIGLHVPARAVARAAWAAVRVPSEQRLRRPGLLSGGRAEARAR